MSGFDPAWLDLREPADHRSRNAQAQAACLAHLAGRESLDIVDLGCGSGSNLRALAPRLAPRQRWRLVDHDERLLAAARQRLTAWADSAAPGAGGRLLLERGGCSIEVAFETADLAGDVAPVLTGAIDLVTAAALFDLVSEDWMNAFCAALDRSGAPLYAVLTYNGVETWRPRHPADAKMRAAFHVHQGRDKGFGPAAGPRAAAVLSRLLAARNYRLVEGASDWRLKHADEALARALADGVADACAETGLVEAQIVAAWRAARRNACVDVGHTDLFAARA